MAWGTASESMVLGLPDRLFSYNLNKIVGTISSTSPSPFGQLLFLMVSAGL